ncbi:MAG: hypothetical protein IJT87_04920 [Ruminiclostridium sp.]|nr:hypothetical protein [Ruminiclostridium sp.]
MAISKVCFGNNTLIDLTADTVTASALAQGYTAHNAAGQLITGTGSGGGGGYVNIFPSVCMISASNGVTVLANSSSDNVGSLSLREAQAGYEGFNIALPGLTVGTIYAVNFDFQYTDAEWFANMQYRSGVNVWDTNYAAYTDYTHWTENLDRDLNKHNHRITFTATETTMYLSFNVCGLADGRINYFEITDLFVEELQGEDDEA